MNNEPDRLNEADYAYFKTAMDGLLQAQSIVKFVNDVLVERYGLKTGDDIQLDGRIIRLEERLLLAKGTAYREGSEPLPS